MLNGAIFGGKKLDEHVAERLLRQAEALLGHRIDEDAKDED